MSFTLAKMESHWRFPSREVAKIGIILKSGYTVMNEHFGNKIKIREISYKYFQ